MKQDLVPKKGIFIRTKRVLVNNKPHRQFLEVCALSKDKLPDKYLESGLCVFQSISGGETRLVVHRPPNSSAGTLFFVVGRLYSEAEYKLLLTWLKMAGQRLRQVNQKRELEWSGVEEVTV